MGAGLFGFFFLLLGLLHFSQRDKGEQARRHAGYFGLMVRGRGVRTVFAAVELTMGSALIALSLLTR